VYSIIPLLPFISSDVVDHLVKLEVEKGNYDAIKPLLPFANHSFKKKAKKTDEDND
jgi:hypothetical protein